MSPLTPEAAVVSELMIKQELSGNTLPLMFSLILKSIVMALAVLAVGVLFLKWNAGLTGFLCGTVLICLGCGDEKAAIRSIPWE